MKCNKYKVNDLEFLAYTTGEELLLNPLWGAELVEENVDPSVEKDLQIVYAPDTWKLKKRTRDKRLEEEGILSFNDLSSAYFLTKTKELHKSRAIRDFVEEKYSEVIEFIKIKENDTGGI